jgi:hypothetical protein
VLVLLAAVAVIAIGGCANGRVKEANAYVTAVNRAQTTFTAASDRLAAAIEPGAGGDAPRRRLRRYYGTVDAFVARLRAIPAPQRVRALHARLIASVERFGASLRSAGAGLTSGDASRILDGQQELAAAMAAVGLSINTTVAAINKQLRAG